MLIIVMGLPGSGKTYFAKAFSKRIGAVHINSDLVRKRLCERPGYSLRNKAAVYEIMFDKVCQDLKRMETVVVDATFSRQMYRKPYIDFTRKNKIPLRVIQIKADEQTIVRRLKKKRPDSDADFAVYKKIKSEFDPFKMNSLALKSDEIPLETMIRQSLDYVALEGNDHERKPDTATN